MRTLCLARETLAYEDGLADFAFAMQGLGSGPISLFGSDEQRSRYLPGVEAGTKIAAFALSEPDAGSDVAAMTTRAEGDRLTGVKTWISNGGIADFYVVFARASEGVSAYIVEAGDVEVAERIDVIAPHPLATLVFDDTPAEPLGPPGRRDEDRAGDARRVPLDRRRGRARVRPARAGRGARPRART